MAGETSVPSGEHLGVGASSVDIEVGAGHAQLSEKPGMDPNHVVLVPDESPVPQEGPPDKKAKTIAATPAAKATTAPRRITIRKGPRVLPILY